MALVYAITEIRPYLSEYILGIEITDTITGQKYNYQFNLNHIPDSTEQDAFAALAENRLQEEIDYEANELNLRQDRQRALEYLDNILTDIVVRIRTVPAVTLVQAQAYIDNKYPDSIVNFPKLYQFYLNLLNLSTWDDFKTFCINYTFREVD